jgi:hypothetical protein
MSVQQDQYLAARYADGLSREDAAFDAGISLAEAALIDRDVDAGNLTVPPPKEKTTMPPRGRRAAAAPQVEEIKQPDFEKAVRIFRQDIKPANEKSGEHAQTASTGYKAIKKDCHVNTRAAKFVFQLAGESEEKRDDVLRSVRGLLKAMNIGITNDLVSQAENEDAEAPIIPSAPAANLELATIN